MDPNRALLSTGPALLESLTLTPVPGVGGEWRARCDLPLRGEITIEIEFLAEKYPFDRHCRFVRHPGEGTPYTFDHLEFSPTPPGLRVGPWPGWRGIPPFPPISLTAGGRSFSLQVMLHGDERAAGVLRAAVTLFSSGDREITVHCADPFLAPLRAMVYRTARVHAIPRTVEVPPPLRHAHPRLLLTHELLPELAARRTGSHAELWKRLIAACEPWDLPFALTATSKALPGPQRLSGEDRLMLSAFIALLDPAEKNVLRALEAFRSYCGEVAQPDFAPLTIDTQSGEILFQLCVGYDWLREQMGEEQMAGARKVIFRLAEICRRHLAADRRDYGQAHYLGCGLGLFTFSLLFRDEHPTAREWSEELRGGLECALRLLPEDGSYPHGMNLWIYEFGFLLRWIEILRTSTGEDLWDRLPMLAEASRFRAATLTPDSLRGITFGDPQYRTGGDSWIHFLIARRTGSGEAQWTGNALLDLPHEGVDFRNIPPRRRVYEFLYYDPGISPTPPGSRPRWFRDIGQLFQQSGDRLFTFRAGAPLGQHRYRNGEYGGYGHSDPASGSFLLYGCGTFLVNGPGPVYRRDTSLHNVITIDGQGMVGDSTVWLPDFLPPNRLASQPSVRIDGRRSAIAWDGTSAYLPHLGVRSLTRALFVDLDRFVVGVDTVACDRERRIEWNLHSWEKFTRCDSDGLICHQMAGGAKLILLAPLISDPGTVEVESGPVEFIPAYPNDGTRDNRLRISFPASGAEIIWALLLTPQPAPRVERNSAGMAAITCADGTSLRTDGRWLTPEVFNAPEP